jgi:hypothetical protein
MKSASHHRHDPYSKEGMLSLYLHVSSSCAQIAAASSSDLEASSDDSKIRVAIKEATVILGELNELAAEAGRSMLNKTPPRHAIEDEPFSDIANALRTLESLLDSKAGAYSNAPSVCGEFSVLRRNLALTRSRMAQNSMVLRQMSRVPEVYASEIDMKGLEALASASTERLHQLVN